MIGDRRQIELRYADIMSGGLMSDETAVIHLPESWPVAVTTPTTKTEMRMTALILSHDNILTTCLHTRHHKQFMCNTINDHRIYT